MLHSTRDNASDVYFSFSGLTDGAKTKGITLLSGAWMYSEWN